MSELHDAAEALVVWMGKRARPDPVTERHVRRLAVALRSTPATPQPETAHDDRLNVETEYPYATQPDARPTGDTACPHGHFGGYLCPECGDAAALASPAPDWSQGPAPVTVGPSGSVYAATPAPETDR